MAVPDLYAALGVAKTATPEEIKRAYRKLAHKHHPDKGGSEADEQKFREANAAYQVLSDPQKRQQYDQFGQTESAPGGGPGGGGFGGFEGFGGPSGHGGSSGQAGGFGFDFGDIFEQFFSGGAGATARGPARGADLEMGLRLTFQEAVKGVTKRVPVRKRAVCETCSGNGAEPGTEIKTCDRCQGAGEIRTTRQTILGAMQQVVACPKCHGEGKIPDKPCHTCAGEGRVQREETIEVAVPAGIDSGQTIRLTGQGEAGERGAPAGHLYVSVQVEPSKVFQRDGSNVHLTVPISYPQAVLGAEVEVPTLHGKTTLHVPPGTPSGKTFRLKGEGLAKVGGSGQGDEIVTVEIQVPSKISDEERELIAQLAEAGGEAPAQKKSWWDKLGL